MHPDLFTIPGIGYTIKSYGFLVMVGFLTATWFAMRRASRVKCDPDMVLNISFIALVFGMLGARAFYVIHYWESDFAGRPNPIWAILDVRSGGFEFLGGVLGSVPAILLYLWIKKESIRVYLDIMAPGLMWGLAFGRIGCLMNGCCFGGECNLAWAVEFPYGSPPFVRQWENREIPVPAELVFTNPNDAGASLVSREALSTPLRRHKAMIDRIESLRTHVKELQEKQAALKKTGDTAGTAELNKQFVAARRDLASLLSDPNVRDLIEAQSFPSREHPERFPVGPYPINQVRTPLSDLTTLAGRLHSRPIHPTQLYSSIHAILLSAVLSSVFYLRRRHGVVFGVLLLTYPFGRVLLEVIRGDNPHDVGGLTASQFVSLSLVAVGIVYMLVIYRLPKLSPYAKAYVPPEDEAPAGAPATT